MYDNAIFAALTAFGLPAAILIYLCLFVDKVPEEVLDKEAEFHNEHYSRIAGVPVTIESSEEDYNCIIDFQDGTLGLGIGATPWEAYQDAQEGERYLGTTGA